MLENIVLLFGMLWIGMRVARVVRHRFLSRLVSKLLPVKPITIMRLIAVVILLLVYNTALVWIEVWLKSQTQFEPLSGVIGGVLGFGLGLCGFDFSVSDDETAWE